MPHVNPPECDLVKEKGDWVRGEITREEGNLCSLRVIAGEEGNP
jgi:hypothetical protein